MNFEFSYNKIFFGQLFLILLINKLGVNPNSSWLWVFSPFIIIIVSLLALVIVGKIQEKNKKKKELIKDNHVPTPKRI